MWRVRRDWYRYGRNKWVVKCGGEEVGSQRTKHEAVAWARERIKAAGAPARLVIYRRNHTIQEGRNYYRGTNAVEDKEAERLLAEGWEFGV
jgi:hypothetical protein